MIWQARRSLGFSLDSSVSGICLRGLSLLRLDRTLRGPFIQSSVTESKPEDGSLEADADAGLLRSTVLVQAEQRYLSSNRREKMSVFWLPVPCPAEDHGLQFAGGDP